MHDFKMRDAIIVRSLMLLMATVLICCGGSKSGGGKAHSGNNDDSGDETPPGDSSEDLRVERFLITYPDHPTANPQPVIRWKAAKNAASYDIHIAKNKTCTSPLRKLTATGTSVTVKPALGVGIYYACVTAKSNNGKTIHADNNGFKLIIKVKEGTKHWEVTANFPGIVSLMDMPASVIVDHAGYVIVVGTSKQYPSNDNGSSWWVRRFATDGTEDMNARRSFKMKSTDTIQAIALDADQNLYIAGTTGSLNTRLWMVKKLDANWNEVLTGWDKKLLMGTGNKKGPLSIVTDSTGAVYVSGGATNLASSSSESDIVIKKFAADGSEITTGWPKILDTDANDASGYITLGPNDSIYLAAAMSNLVGPSTELDWIVKRYEANGNEVWSHTKGGLGNDFPKAITSDADGDVYVAGSGRNLVAADSNTDARVIKYSSDGTENYQIEYDNEKSNNDSPTAIGLASDGSLYVGNLVKSATTDYDWHIRKFSSTGSEVLPGWRKTISLTTSGFDYLTSMALSNNQLYVIGRGSDITENGSWDDGMIVKFNPDGTEANDNWPKIIDHKIPPESRANACAVDSKGNLYVLGSGYRIAADNSGYDAWLKRFGPDGKEHTSWNHLFHNNGFEGGAAIVVDGADNVYVGIDLTQSHASSGNQGWRIKKFAPNGSEDTLNWNLSFAASDATHISSMLIDKTHKHLYVVGHTSISGQDVYDWRVKKFMLDGKEITNGWDLRERIGSSSSTATAALDSKGQLYIGGTVDDAYDWWIKKFTSDGVTIPDWEKQIDLSGQDFLKALSVGKNDELYAFGEVGGLQIKRFNAAGKEELTQWNRNIEIGLINYASALLVHPWDGVFIGGQTLRSGTSSGLDWFIKKIKADGTEDHVAWGNHYLDGNAEKDELNAMCIGPDGDIFAVGSGINLKNSPGESLWIQKFGGP